VAQIDRDSGAPEIAKTPAMEKFGTPREHIQDESRQTQDPQDDPNFGQQSTLTTWLAKMESCLPISVDMATDQVRLRLITPVVFLLIYYMVAVLATGRTIDDFEYVGKVSYVSAPPSTIELGNKPRRKPVARITSNIRTGMADKELSVNIEDWKPLDISHHIDCSRNAMVENEHTLWWYTISDVCQPTLAGEKKFYTDKLGLVKIPDLQIETGAIGTYTIKVSHKGPTGDISVIHEMDVLSKTLAVHPISPCPLYAKANTVLKPIAFSVDTGKFNKDGVIAVAFSWQEPDFNAQFRQLQSRELFAEETIVNFVNGKDSYGEGLCSDGQNMAYLTNGGPGNGETCNGETCKGIPPMKPARSEPTNTSGIGFFKNLRIVTATSPCVFINFQTDDAIVSWNSQNIGLGEKLSPPVSSGPSGENGNAYPMPTGGGKQPFHVAPIRLLTDVTSVEIHHKNTGWSSLPMMRLR
jgi:hypothetical protein